MKKSFGEIVRNQSKKSLYVEFLLASIISIILVVFLVIYFKYYKNNIHPLQYAIFILWTSSIVYAYIFAVKKYYTDKILISENVLSIISLVIVPMLIAPILMVKYIISLFKK